MGRSEGVSPEKAAGEGFSEELKLESCGPARGGKGGRSDGNGGRGLAGQRHGAGSKPGSSAEPRRRCSWLGNETRWGRGGGVPWGLITWNLLGPVSSRAQSHPQNPSPCSLRPSLLFFGTERRWEA